MSQLDELYEEKETCHKKEVSVTKKVDAAEEEIIRKKILPVLSKNVESALQPIKRNLTMVVDYVPGQPLEIYLSRKQNFIAEMTDIKKISLDPEVTHGNHESPLKTKKGPIKDMSIIFPNGKVIAENTNKKTLYKFVMGIGVAKVREVVEKYNLIINKVPLISNQKVKRYGKAQMDLGNGWLLMTHCDTDKKKKMIETISDKLGLGVTVTLKEREKKQKK